MSTSIVVVEDDRNTSTLLHTILTNAGYQVVLWDRGDGAHALIQREQPQLVILDLWLEQPGTGSLLLGILTRDPTTWHIPIIICTGHKELLGDQAAQLHHLGYRLLEKPFAPNTLLALVQSLLVPSQALQAGME